MPERIINLDDHRRDKAVSSKDAHAYLERLSQIEDLVEQLDELGVSTRDELVELLDELEAMAPETVE